MTCQHPSILKLLAVATTAAYGITFQAVGCTEITYATNPNYPPYGWATDDVSYRGASKELLNLLVPQGVALKPVVVPWQRAQIMAKKGDIDMLLSIRVTPEREQYLNFFPAPAFANSIVIFALQDSQLKTASWSHLQKYRGGVSRGDSFGSGFDEYLKQNLSVEVALNMTANFKKLALGRIDYFVSSEYLGRAYLARRPEVRKAKIVSLMPPVNTDMIHFAFSKSSACNSLMATMNARLAELNRKGVPQRLLNEALKDGLHNPRANGTALDMPIPRPNLANPDDGNATDIPLNAPDGRPSSSAPRGGQTRSGPPIPFL